MKITSWIGLMGSLVFFAAAASAEGNAFLGRWALTPSGGGAGWLEVCQENGFLEGTLLWMGGSPEHQTSVYLDGDTLHAIRIRNDEVKDDSGKVVRTQAHPIVVTAAVSGDEMQGMFSEPSTDGSVTYKKEFTGMRIPPVPPAPEMGKIRLGKPIELFNGKNLDGWAVMGGAYWAALGLKRPEGQTISGWVPKDESVANGWSVEDGVLVNNPVQKEGQPYIRYGNLQTTQDFEDFNLTLEVNVIPNGNSGIYLRGIYEVQVIDSYGKALDSHNMGALYGRITPLLSAEKPAGEWQTLDITLLDRHVTVKLNGTTIIDNQPLMGCTGGALWADELKPGPLYFQGDHTGVKYRNIVLRPVIK